MTIDFISEEVYQVFREWLEGQWPAESDCEWVVYQKAPNCYKAYQKKIEPVEET